MNRTCSHFNNYSAVITGKVQGIVNSAIQALVIDDNISNLMVIGSLLTNMNIQHHVVRDVNALPDVMQQLDHLDFVLLDLSLENATGYEVFDALRQEYGITAPIVAWTVYANEANNARRYGFHSFLTKPVEALRFERSVRSILNNVPVWETE